MHLDILLCAGEMHVKGTDTYLSAYLSTRVSLDEEAVCHAQAPGITTSVIDEGQPT
jgi:hypothetical protein